MGRKIGGVFLGLLAAGLVVALVEGLGQWAFPPPAGFDPKAPDLSLVPLPAILSVALAWVLGPLTGGLVATWVGKPKGPVPALVVGMVFLAADIANLVLIPSPLWLWVVGLLAPLPAAWLGFAWARRHRAPN
jgi:hypothetical protein